MFYIIEIARIPAPVTAGHHGARPAAYFADSLDDVIGFGLNSWADAVRDGCRIMLVFDAKYHGPPRAAITPACPLGPEYVHVTKWDATPAVALYRTGKKAGPVVEGIPPPKECPAEWWESWQGCGGREVRGVQN